MAKRFAQGSVLPAHLIRYLTNRVIQQFKEEYFLEHKKPYTYVNDSVLFGYGKYDVSGFDSIKTYVCKHEGVKAVVAEYLKHRVSDSPHKVNSPEHVIESNYLWKKNHEAREQPNKIIAFKEHYRDIFLEYIGVSLDDVDNELESSYVYYIGYYISFADFKLKTLLFKASLAVDEKDQHELTVEGVHAKKGANREDIYVGKMWQEDGWLYGYAKGQDAPQRRISIMGSVKKQESITNNTIIRLFLQGITYDEERLFSWEVLLHKIDGKKLPTFRQPKLAEIGPVDPMVIGHPELDLTSLYLTLHRNAMSFKSERLNNIRDIKAKGTPVLAVSGIIGTYTAWNFDFDFKGIIQSSFSVLDGDIGTLKTFVPSNDRMDRSTVNNAAWRPEITPSLQKQDSLINISKAHSLSRRHKAVAITFNKIDMVNVAMFDLPAAEDFNNQTILTGAFSTLSDQLHGNVSGYFAMKKNPTSEVEVKWIPLENAYVYAKEQNLLPLLEGLLQINKKNHLLPIEQKDAMISKILDEIKKNTPIPILQDGAPGGWE